MFYVITKASWRIQAYLNWSYPRNFNTINYHAVREAVVAGILYVAKEDGMTNIADLLTKPLTEFHWVTLLHSVLYNLQVQ
jgi:hypothetical protein